MFDSLRAGVLHLWKTEVIFKNLRYWGGFKKFCGGGGVGVEGLDVWYVAFVLLSELLTGERSGVQSSERDRRKVAGEEWIHVSCGHVPEQ